MTVLLSGAVVSVALAATINADLLLVVSNAKNEVEESGGLFETLLPDEYSSSNALLYQDAFRHTYVSGVLMMHLRDVYGFDTETANLIAKQYGYSNEFVHPNAPRDVIMDIHNNMLGRQLAEGVTTKEALAALVALSVKDLGEDSSSNHIYNDAVIFQASDPRTLSNPDPFLDAFQEVGSIASTITNIHLAAISRPNFADPLTLDLDKDGVVDLRPVTDGRTFDTDEDGFIERVGWVKAEDGMLARDLNADGQITSQSELFGNSTTSGFTMLATLDSNSDGKIDVNDTAFSTLKVWQDANQDGIGQSTELHTLTELGIKSINLTTTVANYEVGGNLITKEGTFTWDDNTTNKAFDVNLAIDNFFTRYNEEYELNPEVLFLPTARGYGNLTDLHVAMSQDSSLLERVKDFTEMSLSNYTDVRKEVMNILIDWANADEQGVHPLFSSNSAMTSELIYVMDAFLGRSSLANSEGMPSGLMFDRMIQLYADRLIFQTHFQDVAPNLNYNINTDKFEGTVDWSDLIDKIADLSPTATQSKVLYWYDMVQLLNEIGTNLSVSQSTYSSLVNTALTDVDLGFTFADFTSMNTQSSTGRGHYFASSLDPVTGQFISLAQEYNNASSGHSYTSGNDIIIGIPGGNVGQRGGAGLSGGTGDDILYGTALNDSLDGNQGNDTLFGGYGHDELLGGDGNDTLYGEEGNDSILGQAGIDLIYGGDGDDSIQGGTENDYIEGNAGNDVLKGDAGSDIIFGGDGNDTIEGGTGKDVIHGNDGNDIIKDVDDDIIYGDAGNDTITGGMNAAQTIYGGDGNDTILFDNVGTADNLLSKYIYGEDGNDTINISRGINYLDGGNGDDLFLWDWVQGSGGGTYNLIPNGVFISDVSGNDTLKIIDAQSAVTLEKLGNDLYVYYNDYTVKVANEFLDPLNFMIDTIQIVSATGTTYDALIDMHTWTPVTGITWTGNSSNNSSTSTGYSDFLYGLGGNDTLNGGGGNDYMDGGTENDTLDGGGQDDILIGGKGTDTLRGGNGNDTYRFQVGDGQDTINNETTVESFNDKIEFTDGTVWGDLHYDSATTGNLDIYYGVNDSIRLTTYSNIEKIDFSDLSTYDVASEFNIATAVGGSVTYTGKVDIISGSSGVDTINLGNGNDTVHGKNGADILNGEGGSDWIFGDAGNDTLDGGTGNDKLEGGADNDIYLASSGYDTIKESGGTTDKIVFGAGVVSGDLNIYRVYNGGDPYMIIDWGIDKQIKILNAFDDSTTNIEQIQFNDLSTLDLVNRDFVTKGTSSADTIYGLTTSGFGQNDTIYGYEGNDTIHAQAGNDTVYGGDGNDIINGLTGNDTLYGDAGTDTINGGDGNDLIYGGSEVDTIHGNNSDDTIYGDAGNDILYGDLGYNIVYGGDGDDTITIGESGIAYGEAGNDTLNGSSSDDVMYGGDGNDILYGESGNNILSGGAGNDTLYSSSGNDVLLYSSGLDTIFNGSGTDIIKVTGGTTINDISNVHSGTNLIMTILTGIDVITFSSFHSSTNAVDRIAFDDGFSTTLADYETWTWGTTSVDTLTGTSSHNTMIGKAGNDTIDGVGGDDDIHGGSGNDTLYGGSGVDLLHGGVGDDILYGQDGLDTMYGGTGADTFVFQSASAFNNVDVIKDFHTGEGDALNISDLLVGYSSGSSDINDFVSVSASGGNTSLYVDRDGIGGTYSSTQIASLDDASSLIVNDLLTNGNLIV